MKKIPFTATLLAAALTLLVGCASTPKSDFVLLSPGVEKSVDCSNIQERRTPDGRLEVLVNVRNLENRRLEVQIRCVFKDEYGFPTQGDETHFEPLILTENSTEPKTFVSMNDKAKFCTISIREAH